jgi:hypothetical protein
MKRDDDCIFRKIGSNKEIDRWTPSIANNCVTNEMEKTIKLSVLEKYLEDQIMLANKLLGRMTKGDDPVSIRAYRRCLQDIQEKFIK